MNSKLAMCWPWCPKLGMLFNMEWGYCDIVQECKFHGGLSLHPDEAMPLVYGALVVEGQGPVSSFSSCNFLPPMAEAVCTWLFLSNLSRWDVGTWAPYTGAGWESADNLPLMIGSTLIGQWERASGAGLGGGGALANKLSAIPGVHSFQVMTTYDLIRCCFDSRLIHDVTLLFSCNHQIVNSGHGSVLQIHLSLSTIHPNLQGFNTCYKDTGLWGVYFVAEEEAAPGIVRAIQEAW